MALAPSYRSPLTSATSYAEMVSTALSVLHQESGINFERISSYIMARYKIPPSTNHFTQVSRNLETMINKGTVVLNNGLYKYAPIRTLADITRAPLGFFNPNLLRMPNVNLVEPNNSAKFQFAGGNVSNDVHFHMNNNVNVHAPTPASTPVIVPMTDDGPSKRGRGRPRKVAISAVKVEPAVIVLDEEDAADGPPVSPVAKKARRRAGKSLAEEYVSKAKEPPRPTCKEVYDVISKIDGVNDDEVMRAVKRFVNGKVDEFDMLKSLPNNRKKRSWILLLINDN